MFDDNSNEYRIVISRVPQRSVHDSSISGWS